MTQRLRSAIAVCVLIAVSAVAADEKEPPTVSAVWKYREFTFQYRSAVAIFACDALKARVGAILRGVGARDDVEVNVDDCSVLPVTRDMPTDAWSRGGAANTWKTRSNPYTERLERQNQMQRAHVRVRALLPAEMTPEILAELERDQSRRELVSRVTGNAAAKNDHPVMFAAQRQTITLSHKSIGLDPVECELLEQMTGAISRLGIRIVRKGLLCSRDNVSSFPPQLTVETLVPVLIGTTQLPNIDGEEKDDAGEISAQ